MRLLIQPVVAQKGPIHGRDPRARLLAALGIALASVFIHHWMTGLLLLGLGLTVGAGPALDQTHAIATQMLQPQAYLQAVLKPGGTP